MIDTLDRQRVRATWKIRLSSSTSSDRRWGSRPSVAWCTTTWGHSRPFTAWIDASVTPPSSAGALSCSASHPGTGPDRSRARPAPPGRRDRLRGPSPAPWLHWSRAVALASSPPSPMCDRSTASTSAVVPRSATRRTRVDVVGQVTDLAGLAVAALALEPVRQASPVRRPSPSGPPGRAATRSYRAWGVGPPPGERNRGGPPPGPWTVSSTPAPPGRRPVGGTVGSRPPSTGIPSLRRRTWTGASDALTRARTATSPAAAPGVEKGAHPVGGPGGGAVVAGQDGQAPRGRPARGRGRDAARITLATRRALRVKRFDAAVTTGAGHR